jgi:flavorubredoxin
MACRKLGSDIFCVGAIDWDRRLFDELIPLPQGTSYNSYLIKGSEKTALLDTVDPSKKAELLENLDRLGVKTIDYLVAHHAEQDHSGSIPAILERYPEAKLVTNAKCKSLLVDLLHVPEVKFQTINDGDELSLGDRTLQFILTPWVHWPETMSTYLQEEGILFSCDFFGSHLATSELLVAEPALVINGAKRYFAEIMMPFRTAIKGNLEKIKNLNIRMIAPSHGPVHDKPEFIVNAYREWTSDAVKNQVVIPFVSMHGSTRRMVDHLVEGLMERGIQVEPFNLSVADVGELAMSLVDAATVVIATPTVLAGAHPSAAYAAFLTNALRPKVRFATLIGSYGWGGKTLEQIKGLLGSLQAEILEPVLVKGDPNDEDLEKLDRLADLILAKHKEQKLC